MTFFDSLDTEEDMIVGPTAGKRVMPLKVFVQTIWVVVDDSTGTVTEHTDGGITVPASEWPTFYERWATDFATLQESIADGS